MNLASPMSAADYVPGSNGGSPVQFIKEYIEQTLNTPPGVPISVVADHYKRQRLIEEIRDSEIEYVEMLKILQTCFLQVLSLNDYVPIKLLNSVVTRILSRHAQFSHDLDELLKNRVRRFDEFRQIHWSDQFLHCWDQLDLCHEVALLLTSDVIHVKQYRAYFSYYYQISELLSRMSEEGQDGLLFAILLRIELCLPKYYAHNSPQGYKRDFSFRAMIQLPMSRVSKYRLFLESMAALTANCSVIDKESFGKDLSSEFSSHIQLALETMYRTLSQINEPAINESVDDTLAVIQRRLVFPVPDEHLSIEALGSCFLRGCLAVAWMEAEGSNYSFSSYRKSRYLNSFYRTKRSLQLAGGQFGVFLFKSYLIFASIPLPTDDDTASDSQWAIKFAVRLADCRLLDTSATDCDAGLCTNYEFSLKLQFEYDFKLWEMLIVARNEAEHVAWRRELRLFIDVINGPHQFGPAYQVGISQSTLESTLHFSDSTTIPSLMVPLKAYNPQLSGKLDRVRAVRRLARNYSSCSYGSRRFAVEVEFRDFGFDLFTSATWFPKSARYEHRPDSSSLSLSVSKAATLDADDGLRLDTPSQYDAPIGATATAAAAAAAAAAVTPTSTSTSAALSAAPSAAPSAFKLEITRLARAGIERALQQVWTDYLPLTGAGSPAPLDLPEASVRERAVAAATKVKTLHRANSENCVATSPATSRTLSTRRWSIRCVFSRKRTG
ncbi:LAMI_0C04016g1_1 [Lachancea mirantina]|uniref:LAMI_0C04016g1_1 n=1 Tax=Lachancea mirantina TaxID=1230905 RepID=A0A1G4J1W0_9SACH|nr:LAMI_0C04016g1_1 [Lachancea mirantina]